MKQSNDQSKLLGAEAASPTLKAKSWWRESFVWLVIAGPMIVVIASTITAYLAFSSKDVMVSDNDPRTAALANYRSLVPAQTASFHAATPDLGLQGALLKAGIMPNGALSDKADKNADREPIQ
jgi:hypothetical protein